MLTLPFSHPGTAFLKTDRKWQESYREKEKNKLEHNWIIDVARIYKPTIFLSDMSHEEIPGTRLKKRNSLHVFESYKNQWLWNTYKLKTK